MPSRDLSGTRSYTRSVARQVSASSSARAWIEHLSRSVCGPWQHESRYATGTLPLRPRGYCAGTTRSASDCASDSLPHQGTARSARVQGSACMPWHQGRLMPCVASACIPAGLQATCMHPCRHASLQACRQHACLPAGLHPCRLAGNMHARLSTPCCMPCGLDRQWRPRGHARLCAVADR